MIVGPSGCGKTTLLRILAGLETPTSGEVEIAADATRAAGAIPMVFQGDSIFPWMTVWDNAAYGLRMRGGPKAEIRDVVDASCSTAPGSTRFARRLSAPALRRDEPARLDRARVRQRSRRSC